MCRIRSTAVTPRLHPASRTPTTHYSSLTASGANTALIRQSTPDYGLDFLVQVLKSFYLAPVSLVSGDRLRVLREQKMLKGHLPRFIYHQVYLYTKINPEPKNAQAGP